MVLTSLPRTPAEQAALLRAFRATRYRIGLTGLDIAQTLRHPSAEADWLDVRLEQAHPRLAAWLAQHGYRSAVWLSASNPRSQLLSTAENQQRHAQLAARLKSQPYAVLPSIALPDDPQWPSEAAFLILDCPPADAAQWAREFCQDAYLQLDAQAVPRLCWTA